MGITSLSGDIVVIVDDVDIEQVCIQNPHSVSGFPVALQAMVAALNDEDVKAINRNLAKHNHTIEYVSAEYCNSNTLKLVRDDGKWIVKFKIREKVGHERSDNNAAKS